MSARRREQATEYLHTVVHMERLSRFARGAPASDRPVRQPLLAFCPTCGEGYFAEQERGHSRQQVLESWEAIARLDGECPDHPHRFAVGPYPGVS